MGVFTSIGSQGRTDKGALVLGMYFIGEGGLEVATKKRYFFSHSFNW